MQKLGYILMEVAILSDFATFIGLSRISDSGTIKVLTMLVSIPDQIIGIPTHIWLPQNKIEI